VPWPGFVTAYGAFGGALLIVTSWVKNASAPWLSATISVTVKVPFVAY